MKKQKLKRSLLRAGALLAALSLSLSAPAVYAEESAGEAAEPEGSSESLPETEEDEPTETVLYASGESDFETPRETENLSDAVSTALSETIAYAKSGTSNPGYGSEWYALGMARGGVSAEDDWLAKYEKNLRSYIKTKKGVLSSAGVCTDYARTILALTSLGCDARLTEGYNLFSSFSGLAAVTKQGLNGAVWGLMALSCSDSYSTGAGKVTGQQLTQYILEKELEGGGWAYSGSAADTDMTAMCVTALSSYYETDDGVKAAVDRALSLLSEKQQQDGGFISSAGTDENPESAAQVIVALSSLGLDAAGDERFVKNGLSALDSLLSFHLQGSGFCHTAGGKVNGTATSQGLYALAAYRRFLNGETPLFRVETSPLLRTGEEQDPEEEQDEEEKDPDNAEEKTEEKDEDKTEEKEETAKAEGKTYSLSSVILTDGTEPAEENAALQTETAEKKTLVTVTKEIVTEGWSFDADFLPDEPAEEKPAFVSTETAEEPTAEPQEEAAAEADSAEPTENSAPGPQLPLLIAGGLAAALAILLFAFRKNLKQLFKR